MARKSLILLLLVFFFNLSPSFGQDPDELTYDYLSLDSLILAEFSDDSLSILSLIDSLLAFDFGYSSLSVRAGYISNIVNAGRDFGVTQYGFSGGFSYYHKSGLYADLTGYWNSDFEPNFNPLIPSLGYMGTISKRFSYLLSYEHYFYFNNDSNEYSFPLTNAMNLSPYYDLKFLSIGMDYSFLFGQETAHRIRPNLYARVDIPINKFIQNIQIMPGISCLFGNATIFGMNPNYQQIKSLVRKIGLRRFILLYRRYGQELYEYFYEPEESNVFGLMNYNLSVPVSIRMKNLSLILSYFYNIPIALPGEDIDYDNNSYVSASLVYSLPLTKK